MDPKREIAQLYNAEYGIALEIPARLLLILIATVMIYAYTGWISVPIWGAGNFVLQLVHFTFLKSRSPNPSRADVYVGIAIYLLVCSWFLSYPTVTSLHEDPVLRICSVATLAATLLALIRRNDTHLLTLAGIILVVGISTAYITINVCLQAGSTMVSYGTTIVATVMLSSFGQTLWANRTRTKDAEAVARRMLNAQRLETVGRMSGGIAHDFNNVLAVIHSNLELLTDASPSESLDFIETAKTASLQASALVRQLLSYTKHQKSNREQVDLRESLAKLKLLAMPILPSNVRLEVESSERPWSVCVDQDLLVAALLNLVANSRDAMPDGGGVSVTLQCSHRDEAIRLHDGRKLGPGNYVGVTVYDTGTGIPTEVLPNISEPFFSTKPEDQGTGLGVYMVCAFAEEVGGGIQVETGRSGTSITLWLPLMASRGNERYV
ncbi:MAG: ATP-binding protein [Planctomycetota bacterium]